jgi:hypothetical protein
MRRLILGLSLSLLLTGGCAVYDRRLEVDTVTRVRPGETTRKQVEKVLGPPREVVTLTNGFLARHYFHGLRPSRDASRHHRKWQPGELLFRTLTLRYDDRQLLVRKLHDESVTPVFRTNAWLFAGSALTTETTSFVARGVTTGQELIRRLGEPASRTFETNGLPQLVWMSARVREKAWGDAIVDAFVVTLDERGVVGDFELKHDPSLVHPFTRR